jgi:hypothetical protein
MIFGASFRPSCSVAGWSSLVARKAHNLEVSGSNPLPATNFWCRIATACAAFRLKRIARKVCRIRRAILRGEPSTNGKEKSGALRDSHFGKKASID